MQTEFSQGNFQRGSLLGIERITALLAHHFPATEDNLDELPNEPVMI
jgi:uncharacterized membrane protein